MAAIYESTGVGEITVTFPDGGKPKRYGRPGSRPTPYGFVVGVVEQVGDGCGSIIVKVTTLTPDTRRVEFIECHDDRGTNERGDRNERAGVRFYIGDDGV